MKPLEGAEVRFEFMWSTTVIRIIFIASIAVLISACSDSDSAASSTNNNNSTNPDGSTTNQDTTAQNNVCPTGSLYDSEEDSCYINCDGLSDCSDIVKLVA